ALEVLGGIAEVLARYAAEEQVVLGNQMDDVVAEGPDGRGRLEVVLLLGHDLDERDDQAAGVLPRGLGRRQEARRWEAGLGGRGSDGTQCRKHSKHNTASERVRCHSSSHW